MEDSDFLIEWAVWVNLDSYKNTELILLKGHLFLEQVIELTLSRHGIVDYENDSFYKKILSLEEGLKSNDSFGLQIVGFLKSVNKIRNKLAHEHTFQFPNKETELWVQKVLASCKGEKFSRFTFKSELVHAFSILSVNVLKMKLLKDE